MDAAELRKAAAAARQFTVELDGFTFRCQIPSDLDMRCVFSEVGDRERASQQIARMALIGWEGVRFEHLVADLPADVAKNGVEFAPDLVEEFFATRGALFARIAGEVFERVNERRARLASAEKNSASTSA